MIPVQSSESEWPTFSSRLFSLTPVNSQTKTSKVRGDKLGGGDPSAAEKYDGRTVDIIGVEEREHCALVEVPHRGRRIANVPRLS
jgi:hypothetical protein